MMNLDLSEVDVVAASSQEELREWQARMPVGLKRRWEEQKEAGREPLDDGDWVTPMTEEEVAASRAWAVEGAALDGFPVDGKGYTCDGCVRVKNCLLAFDRYNTDGDCLAEK